VKLFGRREHVECKANILAMARVVQAGTRASRQYFQRSNRRAQQAKNGGYALIRTGDPIIMSDVL
jgi:hypothetical protein